MSIGRYQNCSDEDLRLTFPSQDAFKLLEKQIDDLAMEDFADALEDPHQGATLAIARVIPSSSSPTGLTEPSAQLRIGYVEHTISAIITRRIFQPFLFVLSDRLRSADQLFVEMSQNLKRKSTRREALWRQRTLHAAFTAAGAKRSINRIATSIVDEIIDAVKPFANRARWQHVTATVRRIVKTAAETWRYARLESSLIIASMDQSDIIQASGAEATQRPDLSHTSEPGRRVLLSLFPTIRREALHESLQGELKPEDQGCVYSPGRLLHADDSQLLSCGADSSSWHEAKASPRSSSNSYHSVEMGSVKGPRPQSPLIPPSTIPKPVLADEEQDMSRLHENHHGRRELQTNKPASISRNDSIGLATEGDREEVSKGSGTPGRHSSPRSVSDEKGRSEDKAHAAGIPDWGGAGGSPLAMGTAAAG